MKPASTSTIRENGCLPTGENGLIPRRKAEVGIALHTDSLASRSTLAGHRRANERAGGTRQCHAEMEKVDVSPHSFDVALSYHQKYGD